jgi:hypothetical protein
MSVSRIAFGISSVAKTVRAEGCAYPECCTKNAIRNIIAPGKDNGCGIFITSNLEEF